jgi:hypothetical protein
MVTLSNIKITGDCSSTGSGAFSIDYSSLSPPITVSGDTFSPINLGTNAGTYTVTGLSAGYYYINFSDTISVNSKSSVPNTAAIIITTGTPINATTIYNTKCGSDNGVINCSVTENYEGVTFRLYTGSTEIKSGITTSTKYTFTNLPAGIYRATSEDVGGCIFTSNDVVVHSSTTLSFGYYTINTTYCVQKTGQIFITGVTGTPPFIYNWTGAYNTSTENNSIKNLNFGDYYLTVSDYFGCAASDVITVGRAEPIGVVYTTTVLPSCYVSNGEVTFNLSGGSPPYLYTLSNGLQQTLLTNQVTFTGLTSGSYSLNVLDAGYCSFTTYVNLQSTNFLSSLSITPIDATCELGGAIYIKVQGGYPPYYYTLSGTTGRVLSQTTQANSTSFTNIYPDYYILSIRDTLSACTYNEYITIANKSNFTFSVSSTTTTCGNNNGTATATILSQNKTGLTFNYALSNGSQSVSTTATTYNFNNLPSGVYELTISDNMGCTSSQFISVAPSSPLNAFLLPTSCLDGNSGTITAIIEGTDGPYTLTWSDNANGQTGIYLTGLTAGTYSLSISGGNGCSTTLTSTIECFPLSATSYSFKYSEGTVTNENSTQISLQTMMYSGYSDLVKNATNCTLSSATFYVVIDLAENIYTFPFYYTETFNNIPDFATFAETIATSVLTIPYIESCTVDPTTNSISIVSSVVNGSEYYADETISFSVQIAYSIKCHSINDVPC